MEHTYIDIFQADNIFVLSPTSPTPLASYQQSVQTNQIVFCHSGKKIFLTTGEGNVKILSYPEFEPLLYSSYDPSSPFTLDGHTSSCISTELQPTGRFLATGGSDSIVALWDTTDWVCQQTCEYNLIALHLYETPFLKYKHPC